jgi:hypothetical protein
MKEVIRAIVSGRKTGILVSVSACVCLYITHVLRNYINGLGMLVVTRIFS